MTEGAEGGGAALTLGQLGELSVPERCAWLTGRGSEEFASAIEEATAVAPGVDEVLDVDRLAWAVGFNVVGPVRDEGAGRGVKGYLDRWGASTPWDRVWGSLVRERADPHTGATGTRLGDLAVSVACEQRDVWQPTGARPVDRAAANGVFEALFAQNLPMVRGYVSKRFVGAGVDAEQVAIEAWSRMFCDHWSGSAHKRFLGLSRITTLVCQIARYVALDEVRDAERAGGAGYPGDPGGGPGVGGGQGLGGAETLAAVGVAADPSAEMNTEESLRHIAAGVAALPPRQRLAAEMVWHQRMPAKEAAAAMRVSEPAVSQMLAKARRSMRRHLGAEG
ncbi:MAG: sigma-70 family RNA polymerase sigma factor [Planctomycetota bacterium]